MPCPYKFKGDCEFNSNVKGARLKAAATLRSRTAGFQDESPCWAIHRFKNNGKEKQLQRLAV
jgi:hypothetical protein